MTTSTTLVGVDPAAVLDQLVPLDVVVAGRAVVDVIRPAYDVLIADVDADGGFGPLGRTSRARPSG
jgi:hypothetical protein